MVWAEAADSPELLPPAEEVPDDPLQHTLLEALAGGGQFFRDLLAADQPILYLISVLTLVVSDQAVRGEMHHAGGADAATHLRLRGVNSRKQGRLGASYQLCNRRGLGAGGG